LTESNGGARFEVVVDELDFAEDEAMIGGELKKLNDRKGTLNHHYSLCVVAISFVSETPLP